MSFQLKPSAFASDRARQAGMLHIVSLALVLAIAFIWSGSTLARVATPGERIIDEAPSDSFGHQPEKEPEAERDAIGRDDVSSGPRACNLQIQSLVSAAGDLAASNTWQLSGEIEIVDPPLTGELYVRVEGGASQVFSAPFGSNEMFVVAGLYADGATRVIEAEFSDDGLCGDSTSFAAPAATAGQVLNLGYSIPGLSWDNSPTNARETVGLVGPAGTLGNIPSGTFDLTAPSGDPTKVLTDHAAFCVELSQSISGNTNYTNFEVEPLETAPSVTGGSSQGQLIPAGGIGRVRAGMLRWLFDNYYEGVAVTDFSNPQGAAFQLAIWDISHDHYNGTDFDVIATSSNPFRATNNPNGARTLAQTMLDGINNLNWSDSQWESYVSSSWHVVFLRSPDIQDLILGVPMTRSPDWGDLPDPFPTLLVDDGARHVFGPEDAYLGRFGPDSEADGQPDAVAAGDDGSGVNDEDGIRIMTPLWEAGESVVFEVTIGRPGYLSAFFDFDFGPSSDGSLVQGDILSVSGPATVATGAFGDVEFAQAGIYEVELQLPQDVGSAIATRWRITNDSGQDGNSATGEATTGEIEDHVFRRMEVIEASAECPQVFPVPDNNNPIALLATVNGVSEVEFYYWQDGVSTGWTSVVAYDDTSDPLTVSPPTTNPVTTAGQDLDGYFNEFFLQWNTLGFDYDDGQAFQIRVEGRDEFGNEVVETVIEFNAATCNTTGVPVTLASFESRQSGNRLVVDWATSSEIANAGFNLYGETADGEWVELTREMVPSEVIDSADPQFYSFIANARGIERLFLEDVDLFGQTELHGPFEVNGSFGYRPQVMAIDWRQIRGQPSLDRASTTGRGWRQQNRDPIRLLISASGVYRFSHEDLLEANLDLYGVPVNHIALKNQGQNVPFHTEARGRFGAGDFIEFYARPFNSLYTDTNVYVLEIDNRFGKRMGQADAPRQSGPPNTGRPPSLVETHVESTWVGEERLYLASSYIETPWYDTRMLVTGSPRDYSFNVEVEGWVGSEFTLAPDYWGLTTVPEANPDHHVQIYFNGQLVHDDWFNDRVRRQPEIAIPGRLVNNGVNTVRFRLPADTGASVDGIGLTGFEVRYERKLHARNGSLEFTGSGLEFRVTGLTTPEPVVYRIEDADVTRINRLRAELEADGTYTLRFQGLPNREATYLVTDAAGLLVPAMEPGLSTVDITSGRADYLMISHPAFIDSLQPLVKFHELRRQSVRVVNVNDIYDQFSYGLFDARAIQDYIRATAESMGYRHVLLVGGDTFDYKNNLGLDSYSFIPSLYTHTDNFVQYAPADALYVDLDGNDTPDLAIGRLPVRNRAELSEVIDKTLEYASRQYRGVAVLATDHQEPGVSYRNHLESLIDQGLGAWQIYRAHLDDMSVAEARNELISGINSGASLTAYLGHSAHTVWSFSGLFQSSDVANLTNFGKPTAVAQWGCWNTYHVGPTYQTLGHRFMLTPNRGAALVMGSSTFSHVHSGQMLGERLIPMLANGRMSAGQALSAAQRDLARTHPYARDAILGWTILGDPALVIGD